MAELPINRPTDAAGEPIAPPLTTSGKPFERAERPRDVPGLGHACAELDIADRHAGVNYFEWFTNRLPEEYLPECPQGCAEVLIDAMYIHPRRECLRGRHVFDGKAGRRRKKTAVRAGRAVVRFFESVVAAIRDNRLALDADGRAVARPLPTLDRAAYRRRTYRRTGRR